MKKIYFIIVTLASFVCANSQNIQFPDAVFKSRLLNPYYYAAYDINDKSILIDYNGDNEISVSEAAAIYKLSFFNSTLTDITGIENFINLVYLDCSNNDILSFDVSALKNLEELRCGNNRRLNKFNLDGLIKLKSLEFHWTALMTLNISHLVNLESLSICCNNYRNFDFSPFKKLKKLYCSNNRLTELDVTGLEDLERIDCAGNLLETFKCSRLEKLTEFIGQQNKFKSLNFNSFKSLSVLNCSYNSELESVYIKNGIMSFPQALNFNMNPKLMYICTDFDEMNEVKNMVRYVDTAHPDCQVNSYCMYNDDGVFYHISGNVKNDHNNNGCDSNDVNVPNLKFDITDGTVTGNFISDNSGNFSIPVIAGKHRITPKLEDDYYFKITPPFVDVTFPNNVNFLNQNFCISESGTHPDLEIIINPMTNAIPGFDTKYEIIVKNKGTLTQSSKIQFEFNDSVLDFVSMNQGVVPNLVNNMVSFDISNIRPFEVRKFELIFNLNSPTETPSLNSGDVLDFKAKVITAAIDETPLDNLFELKHNVVNSFDPNDITCLEGNHVATSKIAQYVHYKIRFENTGTYFAENISVKCELDGSKFDVNSVVSLQGSHNFITKRNGNKIEFIFSNIKLPFDDANNDGYVVFKIKTLPSLIEGDTFSCSAAIYFDFNFPIYTNEATTLIKNNETEEVPDNYVDLITSYPNPVSDSLKIETHNELKINEIRIFNVLGQLVLVIPNAQNVKTVDVSSLTSGNYFIKINSNKGTSNTKFIKN